MEGLLTAGNTRLSHPGVGGDAVLRGFVAGVSKQSRGGHKDPEEKGDPVMGTVRGGGISNS